MVQWLALSPYIRQVVMGFILGVMGGAICSPCACRGCRGDPLCQTQSFFCSNVWIPVYERFYEFEKKNIHNRFVVFYLCLPKINR